MVRNEQTKTGRHPQVRIFSTEKVYVFGGGFRSLDSITPTAKKPREDAGRGAKLPEIRFAVANPGVKIQLQAIPQQLIGFRCFINIETYRSLQSQMVKISSIV